MLVKFYNTNSSNNTINKILTDETTYNIKFKNVADFLKPTIELKSETIFNYNYCYIEDFKRYYFVENIEVKPNKIYTIDLNVDVLESFKDDILNSYILNSEYAIELINSNVELNRNENDLVMVTVGGI